MKILHIFPHPVERGVNVLNQTVLGLVAGLAEIGLKVSLLSSYPINPDKSLIEIPGVTVLRGPTKRRKNPWCISKGWVSKIEREFGRPDIVHFHFVYDSFQTALARLFKQMGWPYITAPCGSLTRVAQNKKRIKKTIANLLYYNSFLKNASAVHALSPNEARDIKALFKTRKVFTVPNGIEDRLLEAYDNLIPIDLSDLKRNGHLLLGFVGRISVYIKGIDLLLEAMAILKSLPEGPKCKFFMVGPFVTRKDKNYVLSTIKSLGLEDTVRLVGPKFGQEKWSYFLACDVFVHASRSEGGCTSLLEAMALGRPILVTPGTNMPDIVCKVGGWQCGPTPESIANALKEIYAQKEKLKDIGRQAHELMKTQFSWRIIAQKLKVEYEKIIFPGI